MSKCNSSIDFCILTGLVYVALTVGVVAQQKASPPDFSSNNAGWLHFNTEFSVVPGGTSPLHNDPAHPHVSNQDRNRTGKQPNYYLADLGNAAILKPWVVERMKQDNAGVLAGKFAFTPSSHCTPAGVPSFHLYGFQPLYFAQTPNEVVMLYEHDHQVRHVYLDVPHSANPKPSWYGESTGHYQGATLVVDTIGLNDQTFVDNFRTPHTEKLHVVERFKLVDGGKVLQVNIVFEDPDPFNAPWSVMRRCSATDGRGGMRGEQPAVLRDPSSKQAGFLSRVARQDLRRRPICRCSNRLRSNWSLHEYCENAWADVPAQSARRRQGGLQF